MIKYPLILVSGGLSPKGYDLRPDEATWAPVIKEFITTYKINEEYVYVDLQHPDVLKSMLRRLKKQDNV